MILIGEKINATIPRVKEAIVKRDETALRALAQEQERAGAGYIDVNVGTGEGGAEDEMDTMRWLVALLKENVKGLLCVDSADPRVLEAGLESGEGRVGLVNSVKATERSISSVLPLASEYGVPVIGLAMDEKGIPHEASERLRACETIANAAEKYGILQENIFFDPLVLPVSTDVTQGGVTLETLRGIKRQFPGAKTVLAASNVSFGLPGRPALSSALIHMAMFLSVDALIVDPLNAKIMTSVKAGEVILGKDRHCRKYTRAFRTQAERETAP